MTTETAHYAEIRIGRQSFGFSKCDISSPDQFALSQGFKNLVEHAAKSNPFSRYDSSMRDTLSLKTGNRLARNIIEAPPENREAIIGTAYFEADLMEALDGTSFENTDQMIEDLIEDIGEKHKITWEPQGGVGHWAQTLRHEILDRIEENDRSKPSDCLTKFDFAEIVFWFGNPARHWEDQMISTHTCTAIAEDLVIDRDLQTALARIGYTITDFRKITGNKHPSATNDRNKPVRGLAVNKRKLATPKQLVEMIDNASTSYFNMVLYSMVPVQNIMDLDTKKPITFSNAKLASYNALNGTFFDIDGPGEVTVTPADGQLSGISGHSPNDICDFVTSYYKGTIKNA